MLILVQKRSPLFHEIIRACKARNLPMAGVDRLKIGAELGVRDLVALLSYLATPEDDLSLASTLRSPLGGLSEAQLYDLAHGRKATLRGALEAARDSYPELYAMLRDLRDRADFLRPYELLERCLTYHGGRARLIARLGAEAEEGISALLDQAMEYERGTIPSLTGFLAWLESDEVTKKRQIDSSSDHIRVMTVHGAKGLEAPIVILPDTLLHSGRRQAELLQGDGLVHWRSRSEDLSEVQQGLVAEAKAREAEERMRLLYVAMTRAESWLIVAGAGQHTQETDSWYNHVRDAMQAAGASPSDLPGVTLRHETGDWPEPARAQQPSQAAAPLAPPDWAQRPPPAPPAKPAILRPSEMGGAKALADPTATLSEEDAMARGTMIHSLIEHLVPLPKDRRAQIATRMLESYSSPLEEDLGAMVCTLLARPELAPIFAPGTLAETPVTAQPDALDGARVYGVIDRLVVEDRRVLAVDYKSNTRVPARAEDIPEGILRQMGAYHAALSQVYPGRTIELAILWTQTAELMTVSHEIVRQALATAHTS